MKTFIIIRIKKFLIRWLVFKPLYNVEKLIDPKCKFGTPKYRKFSVFIYKIAKWAIN